MIVEGNVGIGTWVPGGALIVKGGNVGLGSNNPGQVLDVTGTVRATAFIGLSRNSVCISNQTDSTVKIPWLSRNSTLKCWKKLSWPRRPRPIRSIP